MKKLWYNVVEIQRVYKMDKKIEELNKTMNKITYLGNLAVREAQEKNRKNGVPNVYSLNGKIVWQMPDGIITEKSPL